MSLGGLAASYCAFVYSDTIGSVLSQSGSYCITKGWRDAQSFAPLTYDTGDLVGEFRKSKRLPIKFYLTIGRFEPAGRMVGTNRAFRDVLLLKGYSVTYNEVNGGHDDIWWRGSFADGLLTLIGSRPTEVNKHQRNPRITRFGQHWSPPQGIGISRSAMKQLNFSQT